MPRARRSASRSSGSSVGGRSWTGCCRSQLATTSGFAPVRTLMDDLRRRWIAVMGPSTIERLVAKALLVGRHVARQLTGRLDAEQTNAACGLLGQHALCPAASACLELGAPAAGGANRRSMTRLVDQLGRLRDVGPDPACADGVHALSPAPARPRGKPPSSATGARGATRCACWPGSATRVDRRARGRGRSARRRRARRSAGSVSSRRSRRPGARIASRRAGPAGALGSRGHAMLHSVGPGFLDAFAFRSTATASGVLRATLVLRRVSAGGRRSLPKRAA